MINVIDKDGNIKVVCSCRGKGRVDREVPA